ncbi:NADPH-dependent ferric siderophore reductase [Paracidovorax avenae]|uniref:siderophore-interacting protein n=1 Tax=Paracidovorax avenae TaxID=80867 RepID=UPI000D153909|nr:siderophore-interacting protein [Paracidovorax avenae]AVS72264.1 NADPH-dependent ferric siderophore reductase [Paracidovorax avenae]
MSQTPLSTPPQPSPAQVEARALQRVRHELRLRTLTVQRAERITPHCVRVTLGGEELAGFHSPGFDDHVKLFLPDPSTGEPVLPAFDAQGAAVPGAPRPAMRDYTPRLHDDRAGTLTIDFALHDAGPATAWALQAAPGQRIAIGGPRGSLLVPLAFDGYVLVGDDTALPAIARRLAELPAGTPALALIEVDGPADEQPLPTQAAARIRWVHRSGAAPGEGSRLLEALRALPLPAGDVHAWVACETAAAKALRAHLVDERGVYPKWIKASGYWRRGSAATHETLGD